MYCRMMMMMMMMILDFSVVLRYHNLRSSRYFLLWKSGCRPITSNVELCAFLIIFVCLCLADLRTKHGRKSWSLDSWTGWTSPSLLHDHVIFHVRWGFGWQIQPIGWYPSLDLQSWIVKPNGWQLYIYIYIYIFLGFQVYITPCNK